MQKIDNDILPYGLSTKNQIEASDSIFMRFAKDKELLKYIRTAGLISNMIPRKKIEDQVHESFAYKIVKYWKPDIQTNFEINEQIPVNYQRTSEMFMRLDGSFLLETNIDDYDLKNRVFLLGYSGPGKEDKYSTPLRFTGTELEHDEPDTYGLVIIANQLRTIIDYNK